MKLRHSLLVAVLSASLSLAANADVKVDIIKNPYGGARNSPELSTNPDHIHAAGLERLVGEWGGMLIRPIQDIRLNAEPLPVSDIVWGGVRDLDPLEADRFAEYSVRTP